MIGHCLRKPVFFLVLGMTVLIGSFQATFAAGDSTNGAQATNSDDCETVQSEFRELVADWGDAAVWAMMAQSYLMEPCRSEAPMKAIEFFEAAAERGNDSAAVVLYYLYKEDKPGLPANKVKALHWLTVAAKRGFSEAAFYLGLFYDEPDDAERNPEKAVYWLERAALKKHTFAQIKLGNMLSQQGQMVGAVMWGKLAESGDAKNAAQLLQQLREDASSAEFAEGEARAVRCLASDYADCSID